MGPRNFELKTSMWYPMADGGILVCDVPPVMKVPSRVE